MCFPPHFAKKKNPIKKNAISMKTTYRNCSICILLLSLYISKLSGGIICMVFDLSFFVY